MKKVNGLSLIELLFVMVIVAILVGIAYPTYRDFITKVNRAEAQQTLLQIANMQEQYYVNHGMYAANLSLLGYPLPTYATASGNYEIRISASSEINFTLSAYAQNTQKEYDDDCLNISINDLGEKKGSSELCWN
ncbi:MAG: type IV pilin protein [Colwellia sp.]